MFGGVLDTLLIYSKKKKKRISNPFVYNLIKMVFRSLVRFLWTYLTEFLPVKIHWVNLIEMNSTMDVT